MEVAFEQKDGKVVARVSGRIDATTAKEFDNKLSKLLSEKALLVDLAGVDYLSSAGMRVILSAAKKIEGSGGKIAFCSIQDDVLEILKVAGFDRVLKLYKSENEALKEL